MSRAHLAFVHPPVLAWARSVARMPAQDAAKKAAVLPERLLAWEAGEAQPTLRQARLLAKAYRVPFATFYLPDPPQGIARTPKDLRRHAEQVSDGLSSAIQLDVRDAWERREIALELHAASGTSPQSFTLSAALDEDAETCGARLRLSLGVRIEEQLSWHDSRVGFNEWRRSAEGVGTLVMQTSDIELSEFRAYSLTADVLPVVVVNRKDVYAARTFSLLHELTHLALHSEGLCDLRTDDSRPAEDQRLEVFCNAVAAAALIPRGSLLNQPGVATHEGDKWEEVTIAALARAYSCSREALLRRLLTFGLTSEAFYRQKRDRYRQERESQPRAPGFVSPPINAVSLLGKPLVRLILDGLMSERITSSDAADYLGVRLKHIGAIAAVVGEGEA